jgi:hypothetical protein
VKRSTKGLQREPAVIVSDLSKTVSKGGVSVQVQIYRFKQDTDWVLEVVNSSGASFVWNESFASDEAALVEFTRVVIQEGFDAFVDRAEIIPVSQ